MRLSVGGLVFVSAFNLGEHLEGLDRKCRETGFLHTDCVANGQQEPTGEITDAAALLPLAFMVSTMREYNLGV
jgi:hypothetical protein